jgi:hypothetical protein
LSYKITIKKTNPLMAFNEDSRVKIPALLHLTRLGYKYLSLKNAAWALPMLMNGQVSVGDVEEELGMVAETTDEY